MSKSHRKSKALAVASDYARRVVEGEPERLYHELVIDGVPGAPDFDALVDARLSEIGERGRPNEEAVRKFVSSAAGHKALTQFIDAWCGREIAACEIAFTVGLAYGRATAGGAR
ncbi:MAG: hypothetical protein Q8L86_03080 [Vicinamibacterales bacterium]|nr:hypothetical protein [Vicinamibacterales bacterium]